MFLYNDFLTLLCLHFFIFFISFYSFYTFIFKPLAPRLAKPILQLSIQIIVSCKKIKCRVNLCNIASVQYSHLLMITSKKWLKRIVNNTLKSLCLSLYRFLKEIKLLTITSKMRECFIASNCH